MENWAQKTTTALQEPSGQLGSKPASASVVNFDDFAEFELGVWNGQASGTWILDNTCCQYWILICTGGCSIPSLLIDIGWKTCQSAHIPQWGEGR